MRKTTRLLIPVAFLILVVATLAACEGGGLSEQQAIDAFSGNSTFAENVTVNRMTKCELSDTAKVQYNIDNAWLINFDYYNNVLKKDETIALAIGEKDGEYDVVFQGDCP